MDGTSVQGAQSAPVPDPHSDTNKTNLERAAAMYKRALLRLEAELGSDHPSVGACRKNYEALLKKRSKE